MQKLAITATFLFAAVSLVGGILGYVNKSSMASLIAGGVAGILLAVGAYFGSQGRSWGLVLALVVSLLLVGRFLPVYLKDTASVWPAGVMALLGALTSVLLIAGVMANRDS